MINDWFRRLYMCYHIVFRSVCRRYIVWSKKITGRGSKVSLLGKNGHSGDGLKEECEVGGLFHGAKTVKSQEYYISTYNTNPICKHLDEIIRKKLYSLRDNGFGNQANE